MKCLAVTLLTALLLGCSTRAGLTYRSYPAEGPVVSSSLALKQDKNAGAVGSLEPAGLLGILLRAELVDNYPATDLEGEPFLCRPETRIRDVIRALETRMGWIYDPSSKRFYLANATHSLDAPDSFGRPHSTDPMPLLARPVMAFSVRFQNASGTASVTGGNGISAAAAISGGGRTVEFPVLDGVRTQWSDSVSRTYFEGVRDPSASGEPRQVNTALKAVRAGVNVELLAARMPGDYFRVDGLLTISTFTGSGFEDKTIQVPLQLDGPRRQWLQIFASEGGEAGATLSVNDFVSSGSFGRDRVYVLIRID